MADRTVAVRLLARVDDYKRNMGSAADATKQFGSTVASHTKSASQQLAQVQAQSTIAGAGLLALSGTAVVAMAGFEKSMSGVAAVSGATAGQLDELRKAALDAGKATVFSASQAADAEAELAKAGVSTADILGGALRGSLDLAAAGGLDLASSATIAAQAMNVFDLAGRDVAHIADVLAAGANKSAADVGELGDALRQGGLIAKQTGLGLEDTVGALSLFADNALVGSDAGTSLKTMLMRLTPQTEQAASLMEQLGITAYDAQGNFIGLEKWAGRLQAGMKDLSPEARSAALNVIFGSDAARAAGVIYDAGAKGVREYTDAVNDQGAASRMASTQLDNLAGDFEALKGSIETAFIEAGTGANDVLRDMVQLGTGAVNFLGDLPGPTLTAGLAVAALGGAFLIAAPRVVAFNEALAASPALAKTAATSFKLLGPAIGVAAIATLALDMHAANEELAATRQRLDELRSALGRDVDTSSIEELKNKAQELERTYNDPGWIRYFKSGLEIIAGSKGEIADTADAAADARAQYGRWQQAVGELAYALGVDSTRAMQLLDESGAGLDGTMADIVGRVRSYVDTTQTGGVATQDAAAAMDDLSDSTLSAEDQLKALEAQWDATVGAMLGTSNAQIAAEKSLADLTEALKKNGNAWDIATEAGRDNRSAFNDYVADAGKVRESVLKQTGSVEKADEAYRNYFERLKAAPGLTDAERKSVEFLIEKYAALPPTKTTKVDADTGPALRALRALATYYASLFESSYAKGGSTYQSQVPKAASSRAAGGAPKPSDGRARGGPISGPGSSTSDSIVIRASNGEYMQSAAAVDKYGRSFMDAVNSGSYNPAAAVAVASPAVPVPQRVQVAVAGAAPVQLVLDGEVVATSLLRFRKDLQGAPLGFDS